MHDKNSGEELHLKGRDEQLALAKTIVEAATELERDLTGEEADQVEKHSLRLTRSRRRLLRIASRRRFWRSSTRWRRASRRSKTASR